MTHEKNAAIIWLLVHLYLISGACGSCRKHHQLFQQVEVTIESESKITAFVLHAESEYTSNKKKRTKSYGILIIYADELICYRKKKL